jgi:hypothetical protein
MVRSDQAIRRHWQLVCCAFSFCWYHQSHRSESGAQAKTETSEPAEIEASNVPADAVGAGKKNQRAHPKATSDLLASGLAFSTRLVGALDHAAALLEWVVRTAPTSCTATPVSVA